MSVMHLRFVNDLVYLEILEKYQPVVKNTRFLNCENAEILDFYNYSWACSICSIRKSKTT